MLRVGPASVSKNSKPIKVKRTSTTSSSASGAGRPYCSTKRSTMTCRPFRLHSSRDRITCSKSGSRLAIARHQQFAGRIDDANPRLFACRLALTESIGTWTHKELDTSENLLYSLYNQINWID